MKEIPLTKGYTAIIDDDDFALVSQYKWQVKLVPRKHHPPLIYAGTNIRKPDGRRTRITMHRLLLGCEGPVDHRDGNGLNNTKANIREATFSQNNANSWKFKPTNPGQFRGVRRNDCIRASWRAEISHLNKVIRLGTYRDPESAARAYDRAARNLHGTFARLNFPLEISA